MRIAIAHKRLSRRGGTEAILYRTAEGLRDLGHEIHLFCGKFDIAPPQGTFAHKVPTLPLGRTAKLLSFAYWAPRIIREQGFDLMVSFTWTASTDVLRCGGGSHKVFIKRMTDTQGFARKLWYGLSPYHQAVLALEKYQFAGPGNKKVIAISEGVKAEIVNTYQAPSDKVVVIYNGVDLERFHPEHRRTWRAEIRNRLGIPLDRTVVLFVGNGFRRKGLDLLIRAWALNQLKDIVLLVVGRDPRQSWYQRWVDAEGLSSQIVFAGVEGAVEKYYASSDVFALPSYQEAFGNANLEALAAGLPIVTTSVSGAAEILSGDLRNGIVENVLDPAEVSRRIEGLAEKARWQGLSKAARETAERYSWQRYFSQLQRELVACRSS